MGGGDGAAVDQHQADGRGARRQHAPGGQVVLQQEVELVQGEDRGHVQIGGVLQGVQVACDGHVQIQIDDGHDRHPELDPQPEQEVLAGHGDPGGTQRDGEGHQRGDGEDQPLEEGHHGPHDAGEQRLLRRPLGVSLLGRLLGGGGELPLADVLVGLHDALLQEPDHGRHDHVVLGIHPGPGDGVQGELDLVGHIPRCVEPHLGLEVAHQGRGELDGGVVRERGPGRVAGQELGITAQDQLGGGDVQIAAQGRVPARVAQDVVDGAVADVDVVEGAVGDVVDEGALDVGAGGGAVGTAQRNAREGALAHAHQGLQGVGEAGVGHRRGGEGLLEEPGDPVADVGHQRAHGGRSQGDVVHHPHRPRVGVLDGDPGRGPEHQGVEEPGHQDVLEADPPPALEDALEQHQQHPDEEADPGELAEVPGAGDHGHGVEDGRQIGRVADGVDLPHGGSSPYCWVEGAAWACSAAK